MAPERCPLMLRFKLLILLCAITSMAFAGPVADLRIQGSNTIGANLGPALVAAMLAEQGFHIVSIDEDNLDIVSAAYREKMALVDLEKIKNNNGKCYLYIDNKNVVGLIMGIIPKYDENDYLDYKCPKKGEVTVLIIKKE